MKCTYWFASVVSGLILMGGCSSHKDKAKQTLSQSRGEITMPQLCKALTVSVEAAQIRDVLHQFTSQINKSASADDIQRQAQQHKDLLQKHFHLSGDEIDEVDAMTFRPLDAHYLESVFLMHDVARHLEQMTRDPEDGSVLPPLELAKFTFGWVGRHVLPGLAHSENWQGPTTRDSWVPSHIVLRRGFGGPRDRALLYLDLLRQMQIDGCLIDSAHPLVGVIYKDDIYLFDPVLCMAVPADARGKGVATLALVQQRPDLLEQLGISPKEFAQSEVILNCPLTSLAPRMSILEDMLRSNQPDDRYSLYIDAGKLRDDVQGLFKKHTREKVVAGIGSAQPDRLSPTRILYSFLPPEDGGSKPTGKDPKAEAETRQIRLREAQGPFGLNQVLFNCDRLLLRNPNVLRPEAFEFLFDRSIAVLQRYVYQAREMELRGQISPLFKRLNRIVDLLDNAPSADQPEFQAEIAHWRQALQDNFKRTGDVNGFLQYGHLGPAWREEQRREQKDELKDLLFAMLKTDSDLDLRALEIDFATNLEKRGVKSARPALLTQIVLSGCCRGLVDPQVRFLLAESVLEKAEAVQARVDSLKVQAEALRRQGGCQENQGCRCPGRRCRRACHGFLGQRPPLPGHLRRQVQAESRPGAKDLGRLQCGQADRICQPGDLAAFLGDVHVCPHATGQVQGARGRSPEPEVGCH